MKPVSEWCEDDLRLLVASGVQESLGLDYKASLALEKSNACRNEISKDFSAFANSAGGQIVYGIEERDHLPIGVDVGVDPTEISREWIEQVANSNIKPRIQGLLIRQISLRSGRACYAVEIPQASALAPHQAGDHKYYKRFNFSSVPMEDYEIRDILRRGVVPDLYLSFVVRPDPADNRHDRVKISIGNNSPEPALYTSLFIIVDKKIFVSGPPEFSVNEIVLPKGPNGEVNLACQQLSRNFSVNLSMPLYREMVFSLDEIVLNVPPAPYKGLLAYRISSPGCGVSKLGEVTRVNGVTTLEIE